MTTFERSPTPELSEALEAVRTLDAAAEECCRVDMRINPALACRRLEQIEERRRELRRRVAALMG